MIRTAEDFFSGHPREYTLYQRAEEWLLSHFPDTEVDVQKTQITFRRPKGYCFLSLPFRPDRRRPENYIILTFGLEHRVEDGRIAQAVEPYPNRWTHHVLISDGSQLDEQLLEWVAESERFSREKRRKTGRTHPVTR